MQQTDEATFLDQYDPTAFPPVAVTVDVAVLSIRDGDLVLLAVERATHPFKNYWSLPGLFVKPDMTLEATAMEALSAKTRLFVSHVEQLGTYGDPDRDPRMRVLSVAYLAFGPVGMTPEAGYHTTAASWIPILKVPVQWPFDHGQIVYDAITRAQSKLEYTSLATRFLPETFTIADLRRVYETVWNQPVDAGNFYRKVKSSEGFVVPLGWLGKASEKNTKGSAHSRLYKAGPAKFLFPPMRREGLT